ncbi:hypothetical protein Ancab_005903 [Ancistrocladus abbreviatus]
MLFPYSFAYLQPSTMPGLPLFLSTTVHSFYMFLSCSPLSFLLIQCFSQLYIFWQTCLYKDALETKADSERSASSPGHPQTIYCPSPCMALSADPIEMFHLLMASFSAILMLTLKATIKTARKCFVNFEC